METEKVALCLDCNYSLRQLPADRCPECGRKFDLNNPGSFNAERPLTRADRMLLKPIGWPTFAAVGVGCAGYLLLALSPGFYYMFMHGFAALLLLIAIGTFLQARSVIRRLIPRSIPRASSKRRYRVVLALLGLTVLLVELHLPLRVMFLLAQPELNRTVRKLNDGTLKLPLKSYRAGPVVVSSSPLYGRDGQYFFVLEGLGGGGFAYNPSSGTPLYYNSGADGPLWGDWYWWCDD